MADEDWKGKCAALRFRAQARERSMLSPDVLSALMPHRARLRRLRGPDAAAIARESAHCAASTSYASARDTQPQGDSVEAGGVTWLVPRDARLDGQLASRVLNGELPLGDILRTREATSDGVMLDIGANIGLTSVTRAVLGDARLVYAAEPEPENFACLVHTVINNGLRGLVLPDCVAISDHDGTARLRIASSIGRHAIKTDGIEVRALRLDTWLTRLHVDVDSVWFVKVDTQGHESHVIDGAPRVLSRPGVVWQLEFSPRHLKDVTGFIGRMQAAFSHFIDLYPEALGSRVRPISELGEALAYVAHGHTDLLAYRTSQCAATSHAPALK